MGVYIARTCFPDGVEVVTTCFHGRLCFARILKHNSLFYSRRLAVYCLICVFSAFRLKPLETWFKVESRRNYTTV